VLILGQGPIGLLFTMLVRRTGALVIATDTIQARLDLAKRCGAAEAWNPWETDVVQNVKALSEGRGADLVIVAASAPDIVEEAVRASRPGARILLFAQTSETERIDVSGGAICAGERTLFGCYSASVDLQRESADLVFRAEIDVESLISHKLSLANIRRGMDLALHPDGKTLKIMVHPQRWAISE
jgi:L-iditol 2-dehydrogenase